MNIGQVICTHRKRKRWSQEYLGKQVDRSPQVISNWECGVSEPKLMDLFRLSVVLELSADYLLGLTDQSKSESPPNLEELLSEPESLYWGDKLLTKEQQDKIMKLLLLVLDEDAGTNKEDESR